MKGNHPDPVRDYEEEKIRMKTAKALMTKKIKRLENAISDYEELKAMNVQNKDLVGAAKEIIECKEDAKWPSRELRTQTQSWKLNSYC